MVGVNKPEREKGQKKIYRRTGRKGKGRGGKKKASDVSGIKAEFQHDNIQQHSGRTPPVNDSTFSQAVQINLIHYTTLL